MTDRYCLDTPFLLDLLVGDRDARLKALDLEARGPPVTTEITRYELLCTVYHSPVLTEFRFANRVERLLQGMQVLSVDEPVVRKAAAIASEMRRRGHPASSHSCLIAGAVLTSGMNTLITRDVEEFGNFPGLRIEKY